MQSILILTVLPHIHEKNCVTLDLFLKSIRFLQTHYRVKLHVFANDLYIDPDPTDLKLIVNKFSEFDSHIFYDQSKQGLRDSDVGVNHTMALHSLIEVSQDESSKFDFVTIMDFDCYFIPERMPEMKEILSFWKEKRFVYTNIVDQYEYRTAEKNQDFKERNIDFSQPGCFKVPRISPIFLLLPSSLFLEMQTMKLLNFHNRHWWSFDGEYSPCLDGDSGFMMLSSVNVIREVNWIIKNISSLPVLHYGGLTKHFLLDPEECKKNLEDIEIKLYLNT